MSLTSFITEKDVRAKLREVFPSPRIRLEQRSVIEPLTNHYTLVGTAFDYLLRFSLQRLHAHAVVKPWIAELAAVQSYYALAGIYDEDVAEQAVDIVEEAKQHHCCGYFVHPCGKAACGKQNDRRQTGSKGCFFERMIKVG